MAMWELYGCDPARKDEIGESRTVGEEIWRLGD